MILINNVSDKKFSLNGTNYAKIYQPLRQGANAIGIYNVNDTRQALLSSTHFSEFEVNGVSGFIDSNAAMDAILEVSYRLPNSGGVGGIDNITGLIVEGSSNVDLQGDGTLSSPYEISVEDSGIDDIGGLVTAGTNNVSIAGAGTVGSPLVVSVQETDLSGVSEELRKVSERSGEYSNGEVLYANGDFFRQRRFRNGGEYIYIGLYDQQVNAPEDSFQTVDFDAELLAGRWRSLIATFPAPQDIIISPSSIAPFTTRFVQVNASNIVKDQTFMYFGLNIDVLSYIYVSSTEMLVEIQSNGVYGTYFPTITNGIEVEVSNGFDISDGSVFIPDGLDSPWVLTDSQVVYTIGGFDAQITGGRMVGGFAEIPQENDFELTQTIREVTNPAAQMYFGFRTDPLSTNPVGDALSIRLYTSGESFGFAGFIGVTGLQTGLAANGGDWIFGGTFRIKRIKLTTTTARLEYYVNDVLVGENPSVNVTGSWYTRYYTYTINKVDNIELKVF